MKLNNCFKVLAAVAALSIVTGGAQAGTIVYGNNASGGLDYIEAFDMDTGALVQQFVAPNPALRTSNGRGIAVVGTTIYYSSANDGRIFKTNTGSHSDDGVFVNTGFGNNGVATIAFNGTNIFATGYNGNNTTNVYDLSGNLVRTLNGLGNGRDGFEVTDTFIVANRGDAEGPYDKYDLNGVLIQSAFIVDPNGSQTTGITFDGTRFYVSLIFSNTIDIFDINGAFIRSQVLGLPLPVGGSGRLLEDLSALGNVSGNPPPGGGVPEPGILALLGLGMAGLAVSRRRKAA